MKTEPSPLIFEACVETLDDALLAERRGAHRIELCASLDQDGLTPAPDLIRRCVDQLSIPVMVMIRPRGGSFVYTDSEIVQMEGEIEFCKRAGVAGVVFGLLTADGDIAVEPTERLLRVARPLDVTFHKAIDHSSDVLGSFQIINRLDGITRVLTSGGSGTAWDGRDVLKSMHDLPDRRIQIVAAGSLTPKNRAQLAAYTGIRELHGKRIV